MKKEKLEKLKNYVEELKTIKMDEVKTCTKFINSKSYRCSLNNGKSIVREKLLKGGKDGSAVIIVPEVSDKEFLVVVEPRVFTDLTVGITFPAGYIENGEESILAAKRELKEETGYFSCNMKFIDSFYQDEGCSSALNTIYLARSCRKVGEQDLDKDEIIRYMTFSFDELLELENLGFIKSGNTKLALEKVKKYVKE